ncbi:MAG: hypothetical protein QM696_13930 [Steroidobacteraceae bacterium]
MTGSAFWHIWGWPILLAVLAVVGLVSALMSNQFWASVLSWIGLGLPLLLILRYWPFRKRGEIK